MTTRDGVDVASFQGTPGQWRTEAGDISWAAVKVTELEVSGNRYVNPDAASDWAWLKDNGKQRVAYLFGHPGTDAADTASFFVAQVRKLGLADADMVAVDLEVTDGKTAAEIAAWGAEVLGYLEHDLARIPLLYTFRDFAPNCAHLERWPLWISDPSQPRGHPEVPKPWTSWAIHQFSAGGAIDHDITAWETAPAMAKSLGRHAAVSADPPAKAPRPKKKVVRQTVRKVAAPVKKVVAKEPVLTAASLNSVAAAAVAWWIPHTGVMWTADQKSAAITIVTAVCSMAAALYTRPARMSAFTAAFSTAAVAAGAFGLHLPVTWIAGELPVISVIVAGLLRAQVSPASATTAAASVT